MFFVVMGQFCILIEVMIIQCDKISQKHVPVSTQTVLRRNLWSLRVRGIVPMPTFWLRVLWLHQMLLLRGAGEGSMGTLQTISVNSCES